MAGPFHSFVIFAEMRTGSNLLEESLNAVPGITCHGEVFNPHFIGYPKCAEILGVTMAQRAVDPRVLLDRVRTAEGLNGFRFFNDHDARVPAIVLGDPGCAKIVLTRNPLDSYVSLKIARQTGQWKLADARHQKNGRIRFDAQEFATHVEDLQHFQLHVQRALQASGQTAFYVDYDDIQDADVLAGLLLFLGVKGAVAPAKSLVKQNPSALEDKVLNVRAMETALAELDRFNLGRTPNFEPRRGPSVPHFVAARTAPVLYMPIMSGPVAQVRGWLAALDGATDADLTGEFNQKTLRQWKRKAAEHRSFTVVRHPVARAHAAFCDEILSGRFGELREVLRNDYKLPLPAGSGPLTLPPGAFRMAFLAFLRFLKGNLNGQTSLRIDGAWASQSAVISGFAQFALPDLVAREDRLAADLAYLASALALTSPALPPAQKAAVPIAQVYDAEIEAAARDAYARDYMTFGFADWSA